MKKKLKEYITLAIILTMFTYLNLSFIKAEMNPFNWEMNDRVALISFSVLMVTGGCAIKGAIENA